MHDIFLLRKGSQTACDNKIHLIATTRGCCVKYYASLCEKFTKSSPKLDNNFLH